VYPVVIRPSLTRRRLEVAVEVVDGRSWTLNVFAACRFLRGAASAGGGEAAEQRDAEQRSHRGAPAAPAAAAGARS
jgi:hypothetical protein